MKWINNGVRYERGNYECLIAKFDDLDMWFTLRAQATQQAQKNRFKQLGQLFEAVKCEVLPMYSEDNEWTKNHIVVFDFNYSGECKFYSLHEDGSITPIKI